MAPLYEVVMLTKIGEGGATDRLKTLIKSCASIIWERGGVLADIKPWGQRDLAYRIRKKGQNYYTANYCSLHVHCSPPTLKALEASMRFEPHLLRYMSHRMDSLPKLDFWAQHPNRQRPQPPSPDLEPDALEASKWRYRNLVMARVFEGRTKQELIAEQLVRHRYQSSDHLLETARANAPMYGFPGERVAELRGRVADDTRMLEDGEAAATASSDEEGEEAKDGQQAAGEEADSSTAAGKSRPDGDR